MNTSILRKPSHRLVTTVLTALVLALLGLATVSMLGGIPAAYAAPPAYCTTLGGSWNPGTSTCTFTGFYAFGSGVLDVTSGTTLLITTAGNIIVYRGGTLQIDSGAALVTQDAISLSPCSGSYCSVIFNDGGVVTNSGTITTQDTLNCANYYYCASIAIYGDFVNSGTVNLEDTFACTTNAICHGLINEGSTTNMGTMNVENGGTCNSNEICDGIESYGINSTFINSNTVNIEETVSCTAATWCAGLNNQYSTMVNDGTINVQDSGSCTFACSGIYTGGMYIFNSGTISIKGLDTCSGSGSLCVGVYNFGTIIDSNGGTITPLTSPYVYGNSLKTSGTPGLIQANSGTTSPCWKQGGVCTSLVVPLGTVAPGDVLVVAVSDDLINNPGAPSISVTDSLSSSFSHVVSTSNLSPYKFYLDVYVSLVGSPGGLDSIAVKDSGPSAGWEVAAFEVSGVTASGVSTTTGSGDCTTGTCPVIDVPSVPFSANSFLLGLMTWDVSGTLAPSGGFSNTYAAVNGDFAAEYAASGVTSPTSFPADLDGTVGEWVGAGIVLQPAPSPVTTTTTTTTSTSSTTSTASTTSTTSTSSTTPPTTSTTSTTSTRTTTASSTSSASSSSSSSTTTARTTTTAPSSSTVSTTSTKSTATSTPTLSAPEFPLAGMVAPLAVAAILLLLVGLWRKKIHPSPKFVRG